MSILTKADNKLIYQCDGETMVIEPYGKNSLRIRAVMMGEILDSDFALLKPYFCDGNIVIDNDCGSITNGKITAEINKGNVKFFNDKKELLTKEINNGNALRLKARAFKPIIGGDYSLTMSFEAFENEKIYGMGQYQQSYLNIKNCTLELAHRNSQASVPFMLSSRGYGLLWHNPAIGKVNFNRNVTEWYAKSTKQLDYWITAGDTPAEIEETYASVTGKVPMMPEYGLGFWQCKLRYYNQEQLLKVAREYKKRNLPIDVIVIDFFHWPKQGDFKFDNEFFPDPKAMVEELKAMNIELMVSVWPTVDLQSENFNEMREKGYLIKPEMGVNISMQFGGYTLFYDATNSEARKFVWEKCKKNYVDYGIKIFWLDEAEPEYTVYDFDNYRYRMGTNLQIGNIYPQMYSRTFYEGMKENGQDNIVNLVRCAWAGSQRYGALVWSGDIHSNFEYLRYQLAAGLNMGIAGMPWWTTDIGGFWGGNPEDSDFRELLVRWFQYATFCPVMRLHGDRKPTTQLSKKDGSSALFTGADNEVWSFGEEVYEICKKYMYIREAIRPYTRKLMKEAHEKGTPVIRTMFYEFPEDSKAWEVEDQYMYGDSILVAPILYKGADKRKVYLPKGCQWTDYNTGNIYEGGNEIEVKATIEVIPIFLKDEFKIN